METYIELIDERATEIVARALAALHEHPPHWCTGHGFGQVAAKLRKPTTRQAVTYTQITDEPRRAFHLEWYRNALGHMVRCESDSTQDKYQIFVYREGPVEAGKDV